MQKFTSSSIATALASATLLLLIIQINAAPTLLKKVRLHHYESGRYLTVDLNTGKIAASTSETIDTTLFFEEVGPSLSRRFKSAARVDQYLSIVKDDVSAHYALAALQTESSGQSGSSSGSSGSGASEREVESSAATTTFHDWKVESFFPVFIYSKVSIAVSDTENCYLAFEFTGEPVPDPCSLPPGDTRTAISIEYV